jgi:predicted phosphodiesterase
MTKTITLIGAIKGESDYTESLILELLQNPSKDLNYGETFTGRPSTQLYLSDKHLIKIKSIIKLDYSASVRWAKQALEKEQALEAYYPAKTWFVISELNADFAKVGNICPLLTPLHTLQIDNESKIDIYIGYLKTLFEHYFRIAEVHSLRLDEGLSNFGFDENGILYYLDDDIYRWDRFVSCGQMLGVYIRSQQWLTPTIGERLGHIIREQILSVFNDPQYLTVLAEQLRDVFLSDKQRSIAMPLINALTDPQKTIVASASPASPSTIDNNQITSNSNRYLALLGDIHANLPALETVLDFLADKSIDQAIVLGDIVGYGPHPAACIERLQTMKNFMILKGNHDHGLATGNFSKRFSKTAQWALNWSLNQVSEEQKKWLLELPPVLHHEEWLALHGAPVDPTFFNAYVYEMTYEKNLDLLQKKCITLCFHGHTHLPGLYGRRANNYDMHQIAEIIPLDQFTNSLICPGSVGQSRNKQAGAQFAIYDKEEQKVQFYNLNYDENKTIKDMQTSGFPDFMINYMMGV